ncbi:hypothetical protein [Inquilinus sp. CA228]|uniref:hypothetical protein n=1 Tax=Inquilinus sp. CA228 TaxID=3455609 RepID=UPI003F8D8C4D
MAYRNRLFSRGAAVIASLLLSSLPAEAAHPPAGRAIDRLPEIRAAVAKTRDAADPTADPGDRRGGTRLAQGNWWNQWGNLWRNF